MNNEKQFAADWWIKWISTVILIIGAILTSFDITPWNKWFSFVGNFGWMIVGYMWKEMSLVIISMVISIIYVIGVI
jgi:hypothetical protein